MGVVNYQPKLKEWMQLSIPELPDICTTEEWEQFCKEMNLKVCKDTNTRWFNIADYNVLVVNKKNKQFSISDCDFCMDINGKFKIDIRSWKDLYSLNDVMITIKQYRTLYKKFMELGKFITLSKDFE